VRDVVPGLIEELRYGSLHNFMGRVARGYASPAPCILTIEAALALGKVQSFLLSGAADPVHHTPYSLKVYDCFRPTEAVADFAAWATNLTDTAMKAEFYPTEPKADLFADGYIAYSSGHSRGSTLDLTIVQLPAAPQPVYKPGVTVLEPCFAPVGVRWADNSIDMVSRAAAAAPSLPASRRGDAEGEHKAHPSATLPGQSPLTHSSSSAGSRSLGPALCAAPHGVVFFFFSFLCRLAGAACLLCRARVSTASAPWRGRTTPAFRPLRNSIVYCCCKP